MDDIYEIPERYIPEIGDSIDSYNITNRIGDGSFGIVFKVNEKGSNKVFALKLLKVWTVPYEEERKGIIKRFRLEYETGLIPSKNLVHTLGFGKKKGNPYIVMEFCPNGDLRAKICSKPSVNEVSSYAIDILNGLNDLHKNGKVHRDLKPDNVLLDHNFTAKLTDFGISGHKNMRMTKRNIMGVPKEIFGTVAYMPPEQVKPGNSHVTILPTVDIYSFGVLIYELFADRLPFGKLVTDSDLGEYCMRATKGQHDDIRKHRPDISTVWSEIINKCLQPDYKNRYQNVDEILAKIGVTPRVDFAAVKPLKGDWVLQVMQGEEYNKIYNLSELTHNQDESILRIGRTDSNTTNDIEINEYITSYISRQHATIEKLVHPENAWYIKDGQWNKNEKSWKISKNGTYINSNQANSGERVKLNSNDIITIGDTTLKVLIF
jgi:serine/threonine protein kinase